MVLVSPLGGEGGALAPSVNPAALADTVVLTDRVFAAITSSVFTAQARDPVFATALRRCVHGNVTAIVEMVAGRLAIEDVDAEWALAFAALAAEQAVPLSEVERAYWVGVQRFWQEWSDGGLGVGQRMPDPTATLFAYVLHVLDRVVERYDATAAELARTAEDQRRAAIAGLVDGSVTDLDPGLEHLLRYRLRGTHVAMVVESPGRSEHPEARPGRLKGEADAPGPAPVEAAMAGIRERSGAAQSVVVATGGSTWTALIGFPAGMSPSGPRRLRRAVAGAGLVVAVGSPGEGVDGLRRSYDEAVRASRLRTALADPPCGLWFADVRLEALLLGDEGAAGRFVDEELGELGVDTERAARIRETLTAWLSTGSQSRAASMLHVHENTVRLRVRAAAEILGCRPEERRTELLVALRLRRALGDRPARPARRFAVVR